MEKHGFDTVKNSKTGEQMNRRAIGSEQEERAVRYLREKGYEILEQNYWTQFAELDIIARDSTYLCFVEVKYRANSCYGAPEGVITHKKKQRMSKAVQYYLREKKILLDTPMRFDVLLIVGKEITLITNAFEYCL